MSLTLRTAEHQKDNLDILKQRKILYGALGLLAAVCFYCYMWEIVLIPSMCVVIWYVYDFIGEFTKEYVDPSGKYVLITGCDSGFGLESAKAIRDIGFNVIACCYDENSCGAQELKSRPWVQKVEVISLDVSSEISVMMCLKEVKDICNDQGLWAVINNAGINNVGPVELVSLETYQKIFQINLFGAIRMTKVCLPLVRQTEGRIVNVTSERGFNPWAMSSSYCVSKFGLEAFSAVLSREMSLFNVKVITIAPGQFGAATAILDTKKFDCLKAAVYVEHSKLSLQDQDKAYPRAELDSFLQEHGVGGTSESSAKSTEPVIKAYVDAILNVHPLKSYFVHGHARTRLDPLIVLARARPFIPLPLIPTVEKILFKLLR